MKLSFKQLVIVICSVVVAIMLATALIVIGVQNLDAISDRLEGEHHFEINYTVLPK